MDRCCDAPPQAGPPTRPTPQPPDPLTRPHLRGEDVREEGGGEGGEGGEESEAEAAMHGPRVRGVGGDQGVQALQHALQGDLAMGRVDSIQPVLARGQGVGQPLDLEADRGRTKGNERESVRNKLGSSFDANRAHFLGDQKAVAPGVSLTAPLLLLFLFTSCGRTDGLDRHPLFLASLRTLLRAYVAVANFVRQQGCLDEQGRGRHSDLQLHIHVPKQTRAHRPLAS